MKKKYCWVVVDTFWREVGELMGVFSSKEKARVHLEKLKNHHVLASEDYKVKKVEIK